MRYFELMESTSLSSALNWMSDEPFNPPPILYHLTLRRFLSSIQKDGLIPQKPKMTAGKGEEFSGIWLSSLDNVDEIVDTHYLPKIYYREGIIIEVNTSFLNKDHFVIGIELPLSVLANKQKISRNQYLEHTYEIVYLDSIPSSALTY